MKPLILDGITYTAQYVEGLKQPLLDVRDCLIAEDKLPYAMSLSEIHAILTHYIEQLEKED